MHARFVSLVLNLTTGRVSPQFHVRHDEFFETIEIKDETTISKWKSVAGFLPIAKVIKNRQAGINLLSPPLIPIQVDDEYQPGINLITSTQAIPMLLNKLTKILSFIKN